MADTDNLPGYGRPSVSRIESGYELIPPIANNVVQHDVTFDMPFSGIPYVSVSPVSSTPNSIDVSAGNITNAGFTIYLYRTGAIETRVDWCAIERK